MHKTNNDTDFKIETVDNFPLPSKNFYEIWQDTFTDMVNKHFSIFY